MVVDGVLTGQACVAELGLCMVRRMWRAGQWGKVMREVRVGKYDMPLLYSVLFIGRCYFIVESFVCVVIVMLYLTLEPVSEHI